MYTLYKYRDIMVLLALSITSPMSALAQSAGAQKLTAAQALYEVAVQDMRAKNYHEACRKLKEAARLHPGAFETRLTLGTCYEFLGKFASAWREYKAVERMAAETGQGEQWPDAAHRALALEKRLARLTIRVPAQVAGIAGLIVELDGNTIERALWSKEVPVDAGLREVVVTAPGHKPWKRQARIHADGVKVTVDAPPLEVLSSNQALQPGQSHNPVLFEPDREGEQGPSIRAWQKPLALVTMGLGLGGLTVGAVVGSMAIAKNDESNQFNRCDAQNYCDSAGLTLRSQAVQLGGASTVAFIAGGVTLAGGLVLLATSPSSSEARPRQGLGRGDRWATRLMLLPGGVQVKGAW